MFIIVFVCFLRQFVFVWQRDVFCGFLARLWFVRRFPFGLYLRSFFFSYGYFLLFL